MESNNSERGRKQACSLRDWVVNGVIYEDKGFRGWRFGVARNEFDFLSIYFKVPW